MAADLVSKLKIDVALNEIRNHMHDKCKDLSPEEYMVVLSKLVLHISAQVDAIKISDPSATARVV